MSFQVIGEGARAHPGKSALIHNGRALSYGEFARAIEEAVVALEAQQLPAACTVVVVIESIAECWVAVLALQFLGITTVCAHSTAVAESLQLGDVEAVVTCPAQEPHVRAQTGRRVVVVHGPGVDIPARAPRARGSHVPGGHILYTSGTTGRYKKLLFSADMIRRCSLERCGPGRYDGDTVFHCATFGLWTGAGYKTPLSVWHAGGTVIIDQRADWCRHYLGSGMNRAILIPDMIDALLAALSEAPAPARPGNFTLMVSAGFITRQMVEALMQRITTSVVNGYGASEINMVVLQQAVTDRDDLYWLSDARNRAIDIVDGRGNPCAIGEEGQLRVHLTEIDSQGYLDDPEATAVVFRDGCFYPGDMAVRWEDGRVRVLGRSVDVINWKGQKLSVAPIEEKIRELLGVKAVCLFSGIDSAGESEVVISLETRQWPDKSDLDYIGCEFAHFEQVRFAVIQPFPRTGTGTGKVDRIALRKLVYSRLHGQAGQGRRRAQSGAAMAAASASPHRGWTNSTCWASTARFWLPWSRSSSWISRGSGPACPISAINTFSVPCACTSTRCGQPLSA